MNFRDLERTFVIAEIGVNHEGDEAVAADLIGKAAKAGADAVKFQTFEIEHYISREQPERYERTRGFQLSRDAFRRLARTAQDNGVVFFSTPFGLNDVAFLDELQPIFKISSGDLTFLDIIRAVAAKRKPMIVSTGLGSEEEIAAAVAAVEDAWPEARESGGLLLMHCVAAYPTVPEMANVRNIGWLAERFGYPVGYSDHTLGIKACELAVASGAVALEKHFTYRKEDQAFHDHKISADPDDLAALIAAVREAEVYLGKRERELTEPEEMLTHMRRSIGLVRDVAKGESVNREDLTWLRPALGIAPDRMKEVTGRTLARDLKAGELLREEDLS